MPVSVTMPRLGESVTEGTVTRWLKQEGDTVEADEPLLEVSTDKVDTEIPSPAAGVLTRIVVREDETADVGAELAVIDGDGSGDGAAATQQAPAQQAPAQQAPAQEAPAAEAPAQEAPAQEAPAQEAPARQAEPVAAAGGLAGEERAHEQAQPPEQEQPAQQQPAPAAPGASDGGSAGGGESTVVTMPALGESVTEGTVTRWLKEVGDNVEVDEPLLEVSTDKVDTEIPSPAAGTLLEIKVPQDETADVGAELAVIGSGAGGAAAPAQQEAPTAQAQAAPAQQEAAPQQPAQQPALQQPAPQQRPEPEEPEAGASYGTPEPEAETSADPRRAEAEAEPAAARAKPAPARPATDSSDGSAGYVTPLVRKLAGEHGVDLASVNGTGVGGRIRRQDVLEAAARAKEAREAEEARRAAAARTPAPAAEPAPAASRAVAPSPLRGRTEKLTRTRATIARRMVESLQISAQLTTVVEVDVTRIARLRQQAKDAFVRTHGVKLSFLPFFALAAVEALRTHPNVNAQIDVEAGTVTYHDVENLGVAVDTEMGLIVPVIKEAGDLNLAGLARRIADVAERTRSKKISPDELSGGTFTLTNTGSRGALFDTPIINQPQVAILGTGAVVKRAVVVDDADLGELILPRSMVYLALSYDHRLVDGADAARFLNAIKERLEAGNFEAEVGLS
jgi:2-oxoglutarate dehydrogenase E2 component (dihydrolipoamide succinyltransferase)